MKTLALLAAITLAAGSLSGCGKLANGLKNVTRSNAVAFDGQTYRGAAKANRGKEPKHFVSTVKGVSKSFEGARQAAEYNGIKHCIHHYGTSDIDWDVGPDTPAETLAVDNDSLTYMGTCQDM